MTKTFTYEDVIRYIYSETTQEEDEEIQKALVTDQELMDFYLDSMLLKHELSKVAQSPSANTVKAIMDYSSSHSKALVTSRN